MSTLGNVKITNENVHICKNDPKQLPTDLIGLWFAIEHILTMLKKEACLASLKKKLPNHHNILQRTHLSIQTTFDSSATIVLDSDAEKIHLSPTHWA